MPSRCSPSGTFVDPFAWSSSLAGWVRVDSSWVTRGRASAFLDAVDREIEDLVTLERAGCGSLRVLRAERAIQDERHLRLGHSTVRAETMAGEPGEIVVGLRRADARVGPADHHHVALAVGREVEAADRRRLVVDHVDTGERSNVADHVIRLEPSLAVDADEAAEGAMVSDEAIRDGADDRARSLAEAGVEDVLEPDHPRCPVRVRLVVHPMVGG